MTILVVDDDPVSRQIIEMTLDRRKLQVESVPNAKEAIDKLKTEAGFTLVITDLDLPGEMSGARFVKFLPTDPRWRNLPVMVCTSVAEEDQVKEAIAAGVRYYLLKPVKPSVLIEKVEEILARAVPVLEPKFDAMSRLELASEAEYRLLAESTLRYLEELTTALQGARDSDDLIATMQIARRVREPAALLGAARVVAAVDMLLEANNVTQRNQALGLVTQEIGILREELLRHARPGQSKRAGAEA
jgi:two-component system chemotaxis response regulator CheY